MARPMVHSSKHHHKGKPKTEYKGSRSWLSSKGKSFTVHVLGKQRVRQGVQRWTPNWKYRTEYGFRQMDSKF